MAWYDPRVAAWVKWVTATVQNVNRGFFGSAVLAHACACDAHAACVLATREFPDAQPDAAEVAQ